MSDSTNEESNSSSQESSHESSPDKSGQPGEKTFNALKILIGVSLLLVVVLVHPISNFFLNRTVMLPTAGLPELAKASAVMQNKCADCHSPGMMVEPIYYGYPYADKLIADDVRIAQKHLVISREHLTGEKKFTKKQMANIENVVENNDMPPAAYKIMHWDAGLTAEDKEAMTNWLRAEFMAARGSK